MIPLKTHGKFSKSNQVMGEFWHRIQLQRIITAYTANPCYPQNDSIDANP